MLLQGMGPSLLEILEGDVRQPVVELGVETGLLELVGAKFPGHYSLTGHRSSS